MSSYSKKIISGKERRALVEKLTNDISNIDELLPKKGSYSRLTFAKMESLITKDGQVILLEMKDLTFPYLKIIRKLEHKYPIISVDIGAIRFVTNGADIMRPGVVNVADEVVEGSLVLVVEETKGAPLCYGIALYDAIDMRAMEGGKCIKNLHYLKDKYWDFKL